MHSWRNVHRELTRLAADRAALDAEEAHWIRVGHEVEVWVQAGFATFAEYLERVLGYARRTARERIRTALALAELPAMAESLSDGRVSWTAARELSRVATAETEALWLEAAAGQSVRQVEEMVAGLSLGDRPGEVRDRGQEMRVLRLEVSGAAYAAFREAAQAVTVEAGRSLSNDELVEAIARKVLGGPKDEGQSSYQLSYQRCDDCGRTRAHAAGRDVVVDEAAAEAVACDAQVIPTAHVGRAAQTVTPAKRAQAMHRFGSRCAVPGCGLSGWLDVHHHDRRADGADSRLDNLFVLCAAHHRAVHAGRLHIGWRDGEVACSHADGTSYGRMEALDPAALDLRAQALSALVNLGYRDREARRAVSAVRANGSLETVLRAALAELRPS